MATHTPTSLLKLMQEKHAFLRTSRIKASDPLMQFKLDKDLSELKEEMDALLKEHPDLRFTSARASGLESFPTAGKLRDYFSELEVNPTTEIGRLHRVNCDRKKPVDTFWSSFLLDEEESEHQYQVYLITACDTQMPHRFTDRLLRECISDEDLGVIKCFLQDKWLARRPLPIRKTFRKSQKAFESYIAEEFELKGDQDIRSFLAGEESNYEFDFVFLAFETMEEDWKDFIPKYYRWIIQQFQQLATGGPKFLLNFIHYAENVHHDSGVSSEVKERLNIFDALEEEFEIVKHINRLKPVPATDLEKWFKRVGVENLLNRQKLTEIVIEGLSPEHHARYNRDGTIDMTHIDLAQHEIYRYLTR
ncbi:hypothetical protein [Neolewinella persica]|uniref:hypothetical protein n=1 Tax=Neolewinella persica TaxID=70998 RepID=UPI00036BF7D2|nr:hypothetical protein [Neolewinella persica]